MKLSRIINIILVVNNKYGTHLSFGDKGWLVLESTHDRLKARRAMPKICDKVHEY